jgi:hypothetical protein
VRHRDTARAQKHGDEVGEAVKIVELLGSHLFSPKEHFAVHYGTLNHYASAPMRCVQLAVGVNRHPPLVLHPPIAARLRALCHWRR